MIGVEQWRAAIGCFSPTHHSLTLMTHSEVINTSLDIMYWFFVSCVCCMIQYFGTVTVTRLLSPSARCFALCRLTIICFMLSYLVSQMLMLLLLLCGDVEVNPGPVCPNCLNVICSCLYNVTPKRGTVGMQSKRRKQCPVCAALLGCRKAICGCGYNFAKGVVEDLVCSDLKRKEQKRHKIASLRANESPENALKRKQDDRLAHALRRANESPENALKRKQDDRLGHVSQRTNESPESASKRKQIDQLAHALQRASESPESASRRKQIDQLAHALQRANESTENMLKRNEQSRLCMVSLRASLSADVISKQNLENKFRMALLRANESPEVSEQRRAQNRLHMSANRNKILSIDEAASIFFMGIKEGPDYVCTVCHRMMYRLGVCPYNRLNYHKCSADMLESVFSMEYVCSDGSQWICRTCNIQLKRGSLPVQAKANGLALNVVPCELSDLRPLELRLICLRVPFMKMVALPTGKQRCIHGPAVNVPSKLDSICNLLPRLPSQTELIPLKFKRKLQFRGHYMYDNVCPEKLTKALSWLKANNALYSDVEINLDWCTDSEKDNSDLFDGLIGKFQPVNVKRNVVTEYDEHYNILVSLADAQGFAIHDVIGDGDCLFNSICYQLDCELNIDGIALRAMTVEYSQRTSVH